MKEPVVVPQTTRRRSSCFQRPTLDLDPHVEYVESLGLFFSRRAVGANQDASSDQAEITQVIERMVRDGTEPPLWVLQELLRAGEVASRFVESCSPMELCVLLHTLKWLQAQPEPEQLAPLNKAIAATVDVAAPLRNSPSSVYYAQFHDSITTAVQRAVETEDRDELLLAFHGDAATLQTDVVALLAAERHNQSVATLLLDALQSTRTLGSLPLSCVEQLRQMVTTGRCVSLEAVQQLASAASQAALITCFKHVPQSTVHAVMLALSRSATASLLSDILALWAALQSVASASGAYCVGGYVAAAVNPASDTDEVKVEISNNQDVNPKADQPPEKVAQATLQQRRLDFYAATSRSTQNVTRALHAKQRESMKVVGFCEATNLKMMDEAFDAAAQGKASTQQSSRGFWKWFKSKMPSLSKLEIMRDFAQTISLVFTSLYTAALAAAPDKLSTLQRRLEQIQIFYRGLANAASADVTAVLLRYYDGDSDFVSDVFFGVLVAVIVFTCLCFVGLVVIVVVGMDKSVSNQSDLMLTQDERVATQLRRNQKRFIQRVTIVLTICQSVHLPVARLGMEILTSPRETNGVRRRYESQWFWTYLYNGALILLPLYVGGLVLLLFFLIHTNAPKVARKFVSPENRTPWYLWPRTLWKRLRGDRKNLLITNLTGERVEFHNSVYAELIKRDPVQLRCPYRSLYGGFEHHWRYYKVWQLTIKVVLTMLLIWFQDEKLRAILTVVVTFLSFLSTFSAPFIDDFDDWMEFSAKGTAFITCLGGVMLAYRPQNDTGFATFVSFVVSAVNILNTLLMAAITMFGTDSVLVQIKNWRGRLTFSNSQWYAVNKPPKSVLPMWDVEYEVRHRVWHAFWKKLLLSLHQEAAIQQLANVRETTDTVRLVKKRNTTAGQAEEQKFRQQQHWRGQADECVAAMRLVLRSVLDGPDVYYEPPRDGSSLETRKGFGKLTVVPYPFHCVFQFDQRDGTDSSVEIVDDRDVAALFFTNFRCDVVRKREVRHQLRALSAWGEKGGVVELCFEREQLWTRPMSSQTQEETETKPDLVPFRCYYTRGVISLGADGVEQRAMGFNLSIDFRGGAGDVLCPDTGELLHRVGNHSFRIEGPAAYVVLGLTEDLEGCDEWRQILQQPAVAQALTTFLPQIRERQRAGREQRIGEQNDLDRVLGSGFRFIVYNNPHSARHTLEKYLLEQERNEALCKVPITHRAALDLLYERLHFIFSDPRAAFWFVFWHDVFEQNGHEIEQLEAYRDQFDPEKPTAICYEPKAREALESWLQRRGLWGERFVPGMRLRWRKNLFHKELLDLLYKCMEQQVATSQLGLARGSE